MSEIPIKSRVAIREEKTGIELMPQDVGVGISQTLPVIIGALHIKKGMFAIEQPELHIHPALQVALGDLFISRSRESQICFLLETHSEHLMLRFLRRIRETDEDNLPPGKDSLKPDQLAVYYVEQGETGVSVFPIRINEDGEFTDRWPKGFFSERAEELF
jgi:predicted ATPase